MCWAETLSIDSVHWRTGLEKVHGCRIAVNAEKIGHTV